jgi:hypothetical protein
LKLFVRGPHPSRKLRTLSTFTSFITTALHYAAGATRLLDKQGRRRAILLVSHFADMHQILNDWFTDWADLVYKFRTAISGERHA